MTPRLGVSACVWHRGKVLIVERSKPPLAGVWSLPGGSVEWGESLRQAAARELMEETGVTAELSALVDVAEVIRREGGTVGFHYAIVCFTGPWASGEPTAGDDARKVQWTAVNELDGLAMTEGTAAIIRKARALLGH